MTGKSSNAAARRAFVGLMLLGSLVGAFAATAGKQELVSQLLAAKAASGKTYTQIAEETGLTNAYVAQVFHNQAPIKPATAALLQAAVPELTDQLVAAASKSPLRQFDPELIQEPLVYRFYEAIMHYGESMKSLINEEFGDGIMSAIDFYVTIDKVKGTLGEDRVVVTMNGKFLPHIVQWAGNNTAVA